MPIESSAERRAHCCVACVDLLAFGVVDADARLSSVVNVDGQRSFRVEKNAAEVEDPRLDGERCGRICDFDLRFESLGLARSGTLFQGIGNSFGLDEVRVESGDEGFVDTSVVLGKYLDPNLYVGYTTGLFNPEGAVLVRYRLNERWEVESRSGQTQSVDIFFQHEHD